MRRRPSEKSTAQGRKRPAAVANRDVCALVADPRLASQSPSAAAPDPLNERDVSDGAAAHRDATEDATRDVAANPGGYQEAEPRDRRAQQDKNAQDSPALLHRARVSAPDADAHIGERPPDRRR